MNSRLRAALLCLILLFASAAASAADDAESFRLEERDEVEEIFNLIFGSPPPMATERGTLLIEAFHDRNGNRERDEGEEELEGEIVCRIDEIDYFLPAFIPGLDYNGSYEVRCSGRRYLPRMAGESILVRRRGEIIRMELPCLPTDAAGAGGPVHPDRPVDASRTDSAGALGTSRHQPDRGK